LRRQQPAGRYRTAAGTSLDRQLFGAVPSPRQLGLDREGQENRMSVRDAFASMDYGPAPESATEARAWLQLRNARLDHFIDGDWVATSSGSYFPSYHPANREQLAEVADGDAADVDRAVAAAKTAQPGWAALGGHARARYLYAM